jgi:hypothetical protein
MNVELFLADILLTGILLYAFQRVVDERADKRLTAFRADLQKAAFEYQTRFAKLHEGRASIIAELYKKLTRVEHSLELSSQGLHLRADLKAPHQAALAESRKLFESAMGCVSEFQAYFNENRIFLSRPLCAKIEEMVQEFDATLGDLADTFQPIPPGTEGPGPAIMAVWRAAKKVELIIPSVRHDIEQEFRTILGAEEETLQD